MGEQSFDRSRFDSATTLHGSPELRFVIPTLISCHAALDTMRVRLSLKERRMRFAKATNINRKSGGAQPRDLRFYGPFAEMFFG